MRSKLLPKAQQHLLLYFQVHQPYRLRRFRFFDIGSNIPYFDDSLNRIILERIACECYLPTNNLLLSLIKKYPQIRITFSISGTTLRQLQQYTPEVLDSFRDLASTGSVEFLCETSFHSLASLTPDDEFETQISEHREMVHQYFGIRPSVFRNTELIYNNEIGTRVNKLGFKGIFCDGAEKILSYRTPHKLYEHPDDKTFKLFLRSYRLSDDIAFRFKQGSNTLTVEKYMEWLNNIPTHENLVNLGMDYETFGEHHKRDSGIFKFLEGFLKAIARNKRFKMVTPCEAIQNINSEGMLPVHSYTSWADQERDLSAWLGNAMQQDAFDSMIELGKDIKRINDQEMLETWRCLQTSDHFYYMSTKKEDDGNVHSYFSPYPSPYEAFINYMNVLTDFSGKVTRQLRLIEVQQQVNEALLKEAVLTES